MKKLISLLLALVMVLSLATVAFAAEGDEDETTGPMNVTNDKVDTSGTITINGATNTYDYAVYKLLHLETYDNANGAYIYKVESKWANFFAAEEKDEDGNVTKQAGPGRAYVNIDAPNGYVTWIGTDAAAFAKDALKYAQENGIAPEATSSSEDSTSEFTETGLTFSSLTLGYYLVDTSMGALCGLNTTKPDAHISVKNGTPTVDKKVEEDSHVGTDTSAFGSTNTADIGQDVHFDVTIDAQAGAQNYIYHDDMDAGLTFLENTLYLKHHNPSKGSDKDVILEEGTHYELEIDHNGCSMETAITDWNCSFCIIFKEDFLKTVEANDKIYITYTAKLNDQAVIGENGNHNKAVVSYGDKHKTEVDTTTTFTYGFEIYKTDANLVPLQGAEFQLLDYNKKPMEIYYNTTTKEYRIGTKVLDGEEKKDVITVLDENGLARVDGLDNGTYYLRETKAPNGFTLLTEDVQFIISGSNLYADRDENDAISVGASVHIENNKGVTLPTTGAAGTTMFIFFGMFVMLTTGVLLVTKKRMSMIEE